MSLIRCSGRYFEETSIPLPEPPKDDGTINASKPTRLSTQPLEQVDVAASIDAPATEAALTSVADVPLPSKPMTDVVGQTIASGLLDGDSELAQPTTYAQSAPAQPDGPVAPPSLTAPPEPEEEADLSAETQNLLDLETPEKPAKVVHLPSEDAQDEQMREVEDERRKKSDTDSTRSRTHLQTQELASSPSSTVGAYSAATPVPPQDSPETSPDSESADDIDVLPPKDMQPSPEEQREQEEHDRLLAAQKDLARRQALGDLSNPDDQLRWEEREAVARDAEEQAAREAINGPEGDAKNVNAETQAEEVMNGVEDGQEEEQSETGESDEAAKEVTQPLAADVHADATEDEDGDNITVARLKKVPLAIDTSGPRPIPSEGHDRPPAEHQDRVRTNAAFDRLEKRDVSVIVGRTGSQAGPLTPLEGVSPMTARLPKDAHGIAPPSASFQTPRRPGRSPGLPMTPSDSQSLLDDLMALKGAADDPDRDYLEPLFRIQAHDSPNVRTTSLPDLVRSASKTISTEDQFASLHERLDYRILRRIYQLQNANKWSLRQMEKQMEPEQSVTHHDHLMSEIQWMRKDFKNEQKTKKSVAGWLARRCADYVNAPEDQRRSMVHALPPPKEAKAQPVASEEQPPDLEYSGESAPENDAGPPTPRVEAVLPSMLVVPPELSLSVSGLQKDGKLSKALESLPIVGLPDFTTKKSSSTPLTPASKFVNSKVLPQPKPRLRKRSRYDYEDDAEILERQPDNKRLREARELAPEDQEIALFHPENKHIRDRLHANNAFRPPSEFVMPSTQFYEFRNGSQWISEDDYRLKKLAKDYSFNWSLIADELQLPAAFKSSAERRTPWECFERWVELEQLPTEMKKTMYFKTWYQRLEQSQQAAERRYQAQVAAMQAANNGQATHVPMRRRTVPTRVEKRKNTRYLWMVDAMRKGARKREQHAYKQAEGEFVGTELTPAAKKHVADEEDAAHRAAAQRKTQSDSNQPRAPMLTPQEFSKKRYERDLQIQEAQRQHRAKILEAQQRQLMAARQAQQQTQQGVQGGAPGQQRPGSSSNVPAQQAQMQPNGQQQPNVNGQMPQQAGRPSLPMATRNGHLAVPQVNAQGVPQAQMRPNGHLATPQDMQRLAHANAQARNAPYGGQQPYQTPNANMQSPGSGGMSAQQQMQSNQAMLANMQQQLTNSNHHQGSPAGVGNHQMSASPSMPPPPTPQQGHPQQLSSGHVPALLNIKSQLRAKFPLYSDDQVNNMATEMLKSQSQTSSQARQSAMNAAAGINGGVAPQSHGNNMQAYAQNQALYQGNNSLPNGNYVNADNSGQAQTNLGSASTSPTQQQYAALMRQRQLQQMRMSPNSNHATLSGGSPSMTHASPGMTPVSPSMQYANPMTSAMNVAGMSAQQRPPSRGATPQMQRLGSSSSVPGMAGLPSPQGLQGSPRNLPAGMAR